MKLCRWQSSISLNVGNMFSRYHGIFPVASNANDESEIFVRCHDLDPMNTRINKILNSVKPTEAYTDIFRDRRFPKKMLTYRELENLQYAETKTNIFFQRNSLGNIFC